jgi:hypothetical protein
MEATLFGSGAGTRRHWPPWGRARRRGVAVSSILACLSMATGVVVGCSEPRCGECFCYSLVRSRWRP